MGVSGYGILDRIVGYTEVIQFDGLSYRTSALQGLARALRQPTTDKPLIPLKSLSRLTSVAPIASAVAATHRSFSSSLRPRCWRAALTTA